MKLGKLFQIRKIIRKIFGRRIELCLMIYYSTKLYAYNRLHAIFLTVLNAPLVLLVSIFQTKTIPSVEMDITSRCTLNCKECTHFMPMHKRKGTDKDFDINKLLENVDLLFQMINKCLLFSILGGEPFLHKELHVLINKLATEPKIKHIEIVTNGTIIPNGENLTALIHEKVSVRVSNYGFLSGKKDELAKILKEHKVNLKLGSYQPMWLETGGFKSRGYSMEEMKFIFFNCNEASCKTLYDGRLWLCPEALHGSLLGLVKENEQEYIDLRTCTKKDFWAKLHKLYNDHSELTTCYYCAGHCPEFSKQIPCAEQV